MKRSLKKRGARKTLQYLRTESEETQESDFKARECVQLVEYSITTEHTETAPNGKPFVAVLEGEGGVLGEINLNGRLYDPKYGAENEQRIAETLRKWREGKDLSSNPHAMPGPVDHGVYGVEMASLATLLLDAKIVGNRVKIKLGFMDTAPAQHALKLREYQVPLGISWEARGKVKTRVMDEKNPFYSTNRQHSGRKYEEIGPWIVDRFALVVDPSAGTYLESAPKETQEYVEALCRDGTTPVDGKCACDARANEGAITPPNSDAVAEIQEETPAMEEKTLTEALAKLDAKQLQTLAPALYQAVVESAKAEANAENAKVVESKDGEIAKLTEDKNAAEAALAEANAKIDAVAKEAAEAARKADVLKAIEEACQGKPFGDKRRGFLTKQVLDKGLGADAVAESAALFDDFLVGAAPEAGVNERERTTEAAKPTAPNGTGLNPLMGIAAPLSSKPATKTSGGAQ